MNNPFYEIYNLKDGMATIEAANSADKIKISTGQLSRPQEQWMKDMFGGKYNPDELTWRDYRKIKKDYQVKAAMRLIRTYLLSKDWFIVDAGTDDIDKEAAEFIRVAIENMDTHISKVIKHMLTAMDYGYSVAEIVYKIDNDSRYTLGKIKGLQIETLEDCFKTDDFGDIIEVIQKIQLNPIPIPVEKTLIYTFEGEEGNPYGESIYKELNDPTYFKKKILLWLAIFLQKHGSPSLAAKLGEDGDAGKMQKLLKGMREGRGSVTHGPDEQVYVVESQKNGEAFFQTWQLLDVIILRIFLIGSLVLGQADAGGSYSQSQTHLDALKLFLDGILKDLEIVFQGLIKRLVDMNFPVTKYPKFQFEKFNKQDLIGLLSALLPFAEKMILNNDAMEGVDQLVKKVFEEYGITLAEVQEALKNETKNNTPTSQDFNDESGIPGLQNPAGA